MHHNKYWSCSAFADKLRKLFNLPPKPCVGSMKEWAEWERKSNEVNKFLNWVIEDLLDDIQDVICCPYEIYRTLKHKFINRFITKTHILNTNLEKGNWHDIDERILHGVFEALVQFVEEEKAHMHYISFPEEYGKYVPRPTKREAGLKYLEWETTLKPQNGVSSRQAQIAYTIIELYLWWKDERPKRKDPSELVNYDYHYEKTKSKDGKWSQKDGIERERYWNAVNAHACIEDYYYLQDSEKLQKLISIRQYLWC